MLMFGFHLVFSVELIALALGAAILIWAKMQEAQGMSLAKSIGYVIIILAGLNILCTSYYAIKYWSQDYYDKPSSVMMHGGMMMPCPMMTKMMSEQKMMPCPMMQQMMGNKNMPNQMMQKPMMSDQMMGSGQKQMPMTQDQSMMNQNMQNPVEMNKMPQETSSETLNQPTATEHTEHHK